MPAWAPGKSFIKEHTEWDPINEELIAIQSGDQIDRLKQNPQSLDPFLGPYPYANWKKWVSLSSKLTEEIVKRLEPHQKRINSAANLIASEVQLPSLTAGKRRILRADQENSLLPSLQEQPGTGLNFTSIPGSPFPDGATAAEITLHSLDTSYILEQILSCWETSNQLLGELQMAFLCFLVGEVYSAFEHWKKLVNIFCSADKFLLKDSKFVLEFIEDLYFQMREVPGDFFVDIVSQNNFLTQTLRVFFDNVSNCEKADVKLKKKCEQLKHYVTDKFQWDFEDEPEDEAPVIVYSEDM
uniref:Protein AAR2 homolog n=1 Tax=Evadne anonyx TaxID=141404 RepID=A0A9N6WXM1_9CRUS|nr:EOG090X0AVR [Evadne anonyx]